LTGPLADFDFVTAMSYGDKPKPYEIYTLGSSAGANHGHLKPIPRSLGHQESCGEPLKGRLQEDFALLQVPVIGFYHVQCLKSAKW